MKWAIETKQEKTTSYMGKKLLLSSGEDCMEEMMLKRINIFRIHNLN